MSGLFFGLPCFAPFSVAQNVATIGGRVFDAETRLPLQGVHVYLLEDDGHSPVGDVTDLNGEYVFSTVGLGNRTLLARYVGYNTHRQSLRLRANSINSVDIAMTPTRVQLGSVVVSATRERQDRNRVAASIGVIDEQIIADIVPVHPSKVMNRIPGVWVNMTTGEGHLTSIRQPLTLAPVYLYLENGIPTRSTGFFNHNALYEINIPHAGAIEVIKGPGTALYGSDAIGGVINVETRAPRHESGGKISVDGGSFGTFRFLGSGGGPVGKSEFGLDLNISRSDGWRNDTPYERQSGSLKFHSIWGSNYRLKTLASFSLVDMKPAGSSGISGVDFETDPSQNYAAISYRNVKALRVSAAFQRFSDASLLSITPYFRFNSMNLLPNWSLTFDPSIWEVENYSLGVQIRERIDLEKYSTRIVAGMDLERSPGQRFEQRIEPEREGTVFTSFEPAEPVYDYNVMFQQASPYLHAELSPVEAMRLSGGLRLDLLRYDYENKLSVVQEGRWRRPADTSTAFSHLSPKLGITYQFNRGVNGFASYRHAFRVPSESQLFRQGAATSTIDLKPVKADQFEIGFRSSLPSIASLEISVYTMQKRDDIIAFIQEDGARTTINSGRTSHRGIEVGFSVMAIPQFTLEGNATWARHRYEEWQSLTMEDFSGNEMEVAPRFISNLTATYTVRALHGASLSLEWARIGEYWMDAANSEKYSGHDLIHLRADAPLGDRATVSLRIHNLTDKVYAERATYHPFRKDEFAPGLPRSFTARLSYRFGK